jgi:hypothetical protein
LATGSRWSQQSAQGVGELARLRLDVNRSGMLLDNDVMADREAEASALASSLCRKERIEQLLPRFWGNACAIVGILISTKSARFLVAAVRVVS